MNFWIKIHAIPLVLPDLKPLNIVKICFITNMI